MNPPDYKEQLATALETLFDLDRFSGCSDLYFRQVLTQRIKALKASGYTDKLRTDVAKSSKAKRKDDEE